MDTEKFHELLEYLVSRPDNHWDRELHQFATAVRYHYSRHCFEPGEAAEFRLRMVPYLCGDREIAGAWQHLGAKVTRRFRRDA